MVSERRLALNPVDWLLAGYLGFVSVLILVRGVAVQPGAGSMLSAHLLFGVLLYLFTRLRPQDRWGRVIHVLYPLIMLLPLYTEVGYLNAHVGRDAILAHDAVVQGWEATLFGGQISYTWIRNAPSVFWSGLLHLAYFSYYPIVTLGPVVLYATGRVEGAKQVLLWTMIAFVPCYLTFILFPVAGPYYAFPHPTGGVREVWSARITYAVLASGSSFGAAFPSSHVAATTASALAQWRAWRPQGIVVTLPWLLLIVATVYCQQHYAVDATAGLVVGVGAAFVGWRLARTMG